MSVCARARTCAHVLELQDASTRACECFCVCVRERERERERESLTSDERYSSAPERRWPSPPAPPRPHQQPTPQTNHGGPRRCTPCCLSGGWSGAGWAIRSCHRRVPAHSSPRTPPFRPGLAPAGWRSHCRQPARRTARAAQPRGRPTTLRCLRRDPPHRLYGEWVCGRCPRHDRAPALTATTHPCPPVFVLFRPLPGHHKQGMRRLEVFFLREIK